jgi:hypothetical protein
MQMSDSALSTHPLRGWRSASWLKPRSTRVGRYGDSLRGRGSSWIPGWSLRFSEEKGHMKLRLKHEETMVLYDHITWFYQQHCDIVDFDTDSLKPLIIRFLHPVGFGCFDDSTNSTNMHLLWDSCHFWGVLGPFEIPQTWDLFSSKLVGSKEKKNTDQTLSRQCLHCRPCQTPRKGQKPLKAWSQPATLEGMAQQLLLPNAPLESNLSWQKKL